jgi:hypothetical protein
MSTVNSGYSAEVQMSLLVGGHTLDVAQCLGNTCCLRQSIDSPPCEADLIIVVDGRERRKQVFLTEGLSATSKWIKFSTLVPTGSPQSSLS